MARVIHESVFHFSHSSWAILTGHYNHASYIRSQNNCAWVVLPRSRWNRYTQFTIL